MQHYNSDDKTGMLMLNRLVTSMTVGVWLLAAMTDVSATEVPERFNGMLPPAAPGPYYVTPVMMPAPDFYKPQPYSMVPRGGNQPLYHQPAPDYSNQANRATRLPAHDNTTSTKKPNRFTE